jgi:hypothetical protein
MSPLKLTHISLYATAMSVPLWLAIFQTLYFQMQQHKKALIYRIAEDIPLTAIYK